MVSAQNVTFEVHEPLPEAWVDGLLTARCVVVAQPAGPLQPVSGAALIKAVTNVDAATGIVALSDLEVKNASFPGPLDQSAAWHEQLRECRPARSRRSRWLGSSGPGGRSAPKASLRPPGRASYPYLGEARRPRWHRRRPALRTDQDTGWTGVNTTVLLLKDATGTLYLRL